MTTTKKNKFRWNAGYYIKEGFLSIFTHGLMSFAAVCMIVACLLIMGTFSLVAVDIEHNLAKLQDENEFLAYLDEDLSEEEALALQSTIEAIPNVSSASFISRDEAWESYIENKDSALFSSMDSSVLRDRYSIHVDDIELLEETVEAVSELPEVVNYYAAFEVANGLISARNVAVAIAVILIAVLFLISLFIISNTIKLATFARRDEIAIMKMCGATNRFIRWPFVVEGLLLGLAGAAIAFFLQWGIYSLIENAVAGGGLLSVFELLRFDQLWPVVLAVFGASGLAIGALGSALAIRKFLQV
ncbi:MAG: permease-like cell division protein FtsX [Oscillospiraceae bacterium]|nr:permease-like cell division protein FtsX [Oscillospiraceae bacterium]